MSELQFQTTKGAEEQINKSGFPLPEQPSVKEQEEAVKFSGININDIDSAELFKIMGIFTQFKAYGLWKIAEAEIEHECAKGNFEKVKTQHQLLADSSVLTSAKEREGWAREQKEVIEAELSKMKTFAYYKLVKSLVEGYEQKYNLCSRELSRRMADYQKQPQAMVADINTDHQKEIFKTER